MRYYSTYIGIIIKHSDIQNGTSVEVHFERPKGLDYAYAVGRIPQYTFQENTGFMEKELDELIEYMKINAHLIWEYAGKNNRETIYEQFCSLSASEIKERSDFASSDCESKFYQGLLDLKIKFPFDTTEPS